MSLALRGLLLPIRHGLSGAPRWTFHGTGVLAQQGRLGAHFAEQRLWDFQDQLKQMDLGHFG